MKLRYGAFLICVFISFSLTGSGGQSNSQEFPKGELIERVPAENGQSYALFLPSGYTPDRKWPILYCFDPREHGSVPVQLYKAAAERLGFIVAGSNNTKSDDPSWPNSQAVQSIWDDTHRRFSLQEGRAYATGFSGGARTACDMGFLYPGAIAGVIGCAGGFPMNRHPSKETPFLFFGIAGDKDSVYLELEKLGRSLNTLGIPARIEMFSGGHDWPPEPLCAEGLEWMEIRAMKDGKSEKKPEVIEQNYSRRLEKARSLEASGHTYDAYVIYHSLVDDFGGGLRDISEIMKKDSLLQASEAVKRYTEEQEQRDKTNAEYFLKIQSILNAFHATEKGIPNFQKVLEYLEISHLKEIAREKKDTEDGLNAERLLDAVFVQTAYYQPRTFLQWGDYDRAILSLSVAAEIKPEDPWNWYTLARSYALAGKKDKALESLGKAVDHGFDSLERIEGDSEFANLHNEKTYKQILTRMKKTSDSKS